MIINVTGFGSTGASAYIDLLKEFDDVQFFPDSMEFQLLHEPDGILDLETALSNGCRNNMQTAISRFKKNATNRTIRLDQVSKGKYRQLKSEYINEIADLSWTGKSIYDPTDMQEWYAKDIFRKFNRLLDHVAVKINKYSTWPPETLRSISSIDEDSFEIITKKYISRLLVECGFDLNRDILLEQLFNASTPRRGDHLLPCDSISIVVDRDPRDVYIITNYIFPFYNRYMPHSKDVHSFIKFYKATHRDCMMRCSVNNVSYLKYEDTIFEYEQTINLLSKILKNRKHSMPKKYFIPENSINNTQLFKKGYASTEEIKLIEKELPDYLYDFESHKIDFLINDSKPFERQT